MDGAAQQKGLGTESRELTEVKPHSVLNITGSKPLRNPRHERYCRLRSLLRPKAEAYRIAFDNEDYDYHLARGNGSKIEKRRELQDRIAFLCRQDEDVLAQKRMRLEEFLWSIHEIDIGEMWEMIKVPMIDKQGKPVIDQEGNQVVRWVQRAKPLHEIPDDVRRVIEQITINDKGNVIPKPYSKLQANIELRKLLGIGASRNEDDGGLRQLSDAELIAEIASLTRELGIEADLNFRFGSD